MNPAARSANDELVNLALIGLMAAFSVALVLRAAATAAALTTRLRMERLERRKGGAIAKRSS